MMRISSDVVPMSTGTSAPLPSTMAAVGSSGNTGPSTTGDQVNASVDPAAAAACARSAISSAAATISGPGIPTRRSSPDELVGSPRSWNSSAVVSSASARDRAVGQPLCMIARSNRPCAGVAVNSAPMLIDPADSPTTQTRRGSPPKAAMFRFTHESAAT
jgi:hypothetical protein